MKVTRELTAGAVTITVDDGGEAAEAPAEGLISSWHATLLVEEEPTEDGRMMAAGSISWRDLPLSLMGMRETGLGGHQGAQLSGRIDSIERSGNDILADGVFNDDEWSQGIAVDVENRSLRGVSVDLAILDYEIRDAETGRVLTPDEQIDYWMGDKPTLFVVLDAVIGMATVCPFQAIEKATIEITADGSPLPERTIATAPVMAGAVPTMSVWTPFGLSGLTASAAGEAPEHPPLEWFTDPQFDGPTAVTITDEGRYEGHLALWESCHIGNPNGPGVCTRPPHSATNYSLFHMGETLCEGGERISTGTITLDTDHARRGMDPRRVKLHYDNTGSVVADVRVGEDAFGIWVSGAIRPELPVETLRAARGARLSGDWRRVNGNLELVAALGVNVGGYPVPRTEALVASGLDGEDEIVALIAAGMYDPDALEAEATWTTVQIEAAAALGGIDAVAEYALGE